MLPTHSTDFLQLEGREVLEKRYILRKYEVNRVLRRE